MSVEKFKITTLAKGKERQFIWDPSTPYGLDHNLQWIIENTQSGIQLRYLGGKPHQIHDNSAISVNESNIGNNSSIELQEDLQVKIQRLKAIPPAYLSPMDPSKAAGSVQQLISFSGIGRALIGSQPVYSAYVAYARGRPIYTFFHNSEGYQIKPLLNGVRLKFKGQKSELGEIGKPWILHEDQLLTTTIIRGSNWWRFNWVRTSTVLSDILEADSIEDQQNRGLWKSLALFAALFFILILSVTLIPRQEKVVEPPPEEHPVVKFIAPAKKMILHSPHQEPPKPKPKEVPKAIAKPKSAESPKKPIQEHPTKTIQESLKKSIQEPPKEPKKAAAPPAEKPPAAVPAPAKPKHEPAPPKKSTAKASSSSTSVTKNTKIENTKKATMAPTSPNKALPLPSTHSPEVQRISPTKNLRDILGGAMSLTQKTISSNENTNSKSNSIYSKNDVQVAPTEIRPGYTPDSSKVGTLGGGKQKHGVGYSQGEKVTAGSQGASFVSVESQDLTVEEGLTKDEVGAVIHKHMDEIRYCHESAMLYYPRIAGKLVVGFTIGAQGNIEKAAAQSSTLPEHLLENCIIKKLVRWRFPHPKGGIRVSVSYPFLFKTLERE